MKYFSINELTRSATATRMGIGNEPTQGIVTALTNLVDEILDPLRELYGKPIIVNSGYRSPELNKAVGGSKSSDHMTGCAVDISAGSIYGNKVLFELINKNFNFDQLIDERGYSWIHVSFRSKEKNRNQILHL